MTGCIRRAAARAALLTLVLAPSATAQYTEPPPPAAYALEDVTLLRFDGSMAEGVTVVVRGPLVETVDTGAVAPDDARVLQGEGLRIYPGLVDAWGRVEADLPRPPDDQEVVEWDPTRLAQGFTPHLRIVDHLTATGASLEDRRAAGIVASGVFPTRGYAAGLGAVLLHRPDAEHPRELVAVPEVGLSLSFQGSPVAYPSTLFGVMADLRQRFADARRLGRLEEEYEESPSGLTRPPWDPDLAVLRRAAGAGLPVFFSAWRAEDIRRVLDLSAELGFSPVVVGGGEAWKVAERLAAADVPVLASLDVPEPRHWEPDEDAPGEPSADLRPRAARERERLVDLYANPGRLEEAGVRFALTSGGGIADLRQGARRAVEYGLSEGAALAALTRSPAEILGIGPAARVVPGWSATFIVTDGPLFDEGTRVLYTFVEGVLHEVERESAAGSGEPPSVDVSGRWTVVVEGADQGRVEYAMTLEQTGGRVTGTAEAPEGPTVRIQRGTVSGDELQLTLIIESGGVLGEAEATAVVEGDRMEGSGSGDFGDFELTARRGPGEEGS